MNIKSNIGDFTKALFDLVVIRKFELSQSLEIIKENYVEDKKKSNVQKSADYIYQSIKQGNLFSNALKLCPYIHFDKTYISFIRFAERTGRLESVLKFLNQKYIREKECANKLSEAMLYPSFVLIFAIGIFVFLIYFFIPQISEDFIYSTNFIYPFVLLILFVVLYSMFVKKSLGNNKIYEAFLACSFLMSAGIELSTAVCTAGVILGADCEEGRFFMDVGERLGYGFSLKNAFYGNNQRIAQKFLKVKINDFIYYAEKSDGKISVFDGITEHIQQMDDKKRAFCLKMAEPFFIIFIGIFVISMLICVLGPLYSVNIENLFEIK